MQQKNTAAGVGFAGFAFVAWGVLPVYWKALAMAPAHELICHRIVWSAACLALALTVTRKWADVKAIIATRRTPVYLAATACLIGVNWTIYVWAVNADRVVDASLGYYITPLVNVLLGFIFLGERLKRLQVLAIAMALLGVAILIIDYGGLPWIALSLAFSFGTYGLVRKVIAVESMAGLFFETALLSLPAGAYLAYLAASGQGALGAYGLGVDALLLGAGAVTAAPLLSFTFGARRIRLATLGVMQYIAPTCMFLLGVLAYGEPFGVVRAASFSCIWTGVGLYVAESIVTLRNMERKLKQNGSSPIDEGQNR